MDESNARSRYPDSLAQAFLWALLPSLLLVLNAPDASYAQVVVTTNITPTTTAPLDLGTDVNTVGTTTEITGGTRPGNGTGTNLFHSFDFFTLGTGDIAHFMNDMQLQTTNIIARVIGGEIKEASTIDGTVRTNNPLDAADPMNFGAANLWLVNPSGLLLGPNARVEVGGSVSMSTANYLRFDGTSALFDMLSSPASLGQLSVAPVVAFGFFDPNLPAPITVQGSMLQVPEGQSLSFVGGDITVQAQTFEDGTMQAANLRAPGGQINLVSVASLGEVLVPSFQTGSFAAMGAVTIKENSLLDVGGQFDEFGTPIGNGNSGTVFVRGGQLVMDASAIQATTAGTVDGADTAVDIQISQDVTLSNGTNIFVGTIGSGQGGDVVIGAENVHLSNFSFITTGTSGAGPGGDLLLNVGTLRLMDGSGILSNTAGSDLDFDGVFDAIGGVGGKITVQGLGGMGSVADSVVLSGGSGIASEASAGSGGGGGISITATSLELDEASFIRSSTSADGTDLNGDGVVDFTGRGGDIVVAVQRLSVVSGALITSSTGSFNEGAAAGGMVTVQGLDGPGSKASSVVLSGLAGIVSESVFTGLPGDLTVNAGTLTITDDAVISAGSPQAIGPAGNVAVTADSVIITANGQIVSRSFAQNSGQVTITADELTMDNGSIATSTSSERGGRGGDLVLNVGTVSLTNGAIINSRSETASTGRAGDITMNVATLSLTNNAEISSNSVATASGDAGIVTIQGPGGPGTSATSVSLTTSSLLTNSEGTGAGGEIQIRAGQVQLVDLALLTAETSGTGKAGSIVVTSDNLSVTGGARIEASTTGVGDAGDITITNTETVSVKGLSSDGSSRSGIFAKTQTSGGGTGGGGSGDGGGGTGGESGGGSGGGGSGSGGGGGGGQTSTAGDAGNIIIMTNNLLLSDGGQIDSSTTTSGSGGRVSVDADAITITGNSTRLKSDASRGNGTGGDIALAARTIGIHDKASVTAATDGSGNAGDISMTADESFTLDSAAIITTSTRGSGSGGTILINSPQVLVDGLGTSITASTLRPFADFAVTLSILHPNVGDLTVRLDSPDGTRVALLSRAGDTGDNFTDTVFDDQATQPITNGSAPFTGTFKPREPLAQLIDQTVAGTWKLNVSDQEAGNTESSQNLQNWSLRVGDQVFQSTNIPRIIPDNGSVSSNLVVAGSAGAVIQGVGEASGIGGDVTINAGTVTVQNGATFSATTRGSGQGGNITITSSDSVTLQDNALVSASSEGAGNAGSITINAGQQYLSTNSAVTTQSAQASGGDITVNAQEMIRLINSQINTSVAGGDTTLGGNITIDPQFVILQNSQILAQAFAGTGGNITIISNVFLADPISLVNASSQLGISGQINIQSPVQNVGEQLTPLSQEFSSAAALLAQQCAARAVDGKFSTFMVAAREGLPVEPGGFLASPSWTAELFGSNHSGRDPHTRFSSVTGAFREYDAKPIQLAKLGGACR